VERLEQEGADHQRDDQRVDHDADRFDESAFLLFAFGLARHAHRTPLAGATVTAASLRLLDCTASLPGFGFSMQLTAVRSVDGVRNRARRTSRGGALVAARPLTRNEWCQFHGARGTAEITTKACAIGNSSVIVRSIRTSCPAGVSASSRRSAPPVSFMVGRPPGR